MKQFRSSPEVDASAVGERVVLYHRGTRKSLVLNPSGSHLWEHLESWRTLDDLAAALLARYPALDRERARRDASAFLAELDEHAMVFAEAG